VTTLAQKQRKERQDISAFATLIASPAADSFTMPAGGKLRFVSEAGATAGTTAAVLTGSTTRTIKTPVLAAGGYVTID